MSDTTIESPIEQPQEQPTQEAPMEAPMESQESAPVTEAQAPVAVRKDPLPIPLFLVGRLLDDLAEHKEGQSAEEARLVMPKIQGVFDFLQARSLVSYVSRNAK